MKKSLLHSPRRSARGFTLVEIAIVIAIITLLALGISQSATYFRAQANKSLCIVIQKQVQDAVRSIENLQNLNDGDPVSGFSDGNGLTGLAVLWGNTTSFFPVQPSCPSGGVYTPAANIPVAGVAFVTCDWAGTGSPHTPTTKQLASY